jgi:hypothetical protein
MNLSRRQISPERKLKALARFAPQLGALILRSAGNRGENEEHDELGVAFLDAATRAEWIVPFDWAAWAETAEGQRLLGEPRHVAMATTDQLAKVLTALLRGERFSEGTLNQASENGLLLAIAQRAETLLEQEGAAT